jgi:hypothetical protein
MVTLGGTCLLHVRHTLLGIEPRHCSRKRVALLICSDSLNREETRIERNRARRIYKRLDKYHHLLFRGYCEVVRELCGVGRSEAVNVVLWVSTRCKPRQAVNAVLWMSTRCKPRQVRGCECSTVDVYTLQA